MFSRHRLLRGQIEFTHPRCTQLRPAVSERLESRLLLTSIVVNVANDLTHSPASGIVSLRDAIGTANSSIAPTSITFSSVLFSAAKTIKLNGPLALTSTSEPTTIIGPTAGVTLDAGGSFSILTIDLKTTATISNVIFYNASHVGQFAGDGGAIFTQGNLTLNACRIENSVSFGGGAIYNLNGILHLNSCMLDHNTADLDGGGALLNQGNAYLTDVTLSNNASSSEGGAISNVRGNLTATNVTIAGNRAISAIGSGGGGIFNNGWCLLINLTISNNTVSNGVGGGIYNSVTTSGVVNIGNSIVAKNLHSGSGPASPDVAGAFNALGFNLIGQTGGSSGWTPSDHIGNSSTPLDPQIGSLANNGGPVQTMLPLAGSPALGAGATGLIPTGVTTDARGLPRTVNGQIDIGAVEVGVKPSFTIVAGAAQTFNEGDMAAQLQLGSFTDAIGKGPYTITVQWGNGTADSLYSLSNIGPGPFNISIGIGVPEEAQIKGDVFITDSSNHVSNKAALVYTVNDAKLTGTADTINAIAGAVFTGRLATFTDADPGATLADFSATITWGGGVVSAGVITQISANTFAVTGTNTYLDPNSYFYGITIKDAGGAALILKSSASVRLSGMPVMKGQAATAAFWASSRGRAIINSLPRVFAGTVTFGETMATFYPNLWGSGGLLDISAKTNAQTAALFSSLFADKSPESQLAAQLLAVSLNTFVSKCLLSGIKIPLATAAGFNPGAYGLGASVINSRSDGAAFGLKNNVTTDAFAFLRDIDNQLKGEKVPYNGNLGLVLAATDLFIVLDDAGGIN